MIQALALAASILAGCWLVVIAGLMWSRPHKCLHYLSLMASTWRINITELGLRALAGLALIVRADLSKTPHVFTIFGWFLFLSAIVILLVPIRLHARYANWWAERIPAGFVRTIAPVTGLGGLLLIYLAV